MTDPRLVRGVVQAFRRADCPDESIRVKLGGLAPGASYEVSDLDENTPRKASGIELMEEGPVIKASGKPAAFAITYRNANKGKRKP